MQQLHSSSSHTTRSGPLLDVLAKNDRIIQRIQDSLRVRLLCTFFPLYLGTEHVRAFQLVLLNLAREWHLCCSQSYSETKPRERRFVDVRKGHSHSPQLQAVPRMSALFSSPPGPLSWAVMAASSCSHKNFRFRAGGGVLVSANLLIVTHTMNASVAHAKAVQ